MNLSTKITAFLIEQNVVSKKNKEVYEYGFDLLLLISSISPLFYWLVYYAADRGQPYYISPFLSDYEVYAVVIMQKHT